MDENQSEWDSTAAPIDEHFDYYISSGRMSREQNDRIWREIYTSEQQEGETAEVYSARVLDLVDRLSDLPEHLKGSTVFYRVKAGLREPIRRVLSTQVFQPSSHARLNDMAMAIERELNEESSHADRSSLLQKTLPHGAIPDQRLLEYSHPPEHGKASGGQEQPEQIQPHETPEASRHAPHNSEQSTSIQILGRSQIEGPPDERDGSLKRNRNDTQVGPHTSISPSSTTVGESQFRLSHEEINQRRMANLCFTCNQPGHMKGECPKNPNKRPKRFK